MTVMLVTVIETVRAEWQPAMRRAGVTEQDCERIARAFLYEGLFHNGDQAI